MLLVPTSSQFAFRCAGVPLKRINVDRLWLLVAGFNKSDVFHENDVVFICSIVRFAILKGNETFRKTGLEPGETDNPR